MSSVNMNEVRIDLDAEDNSAVEVGMRPKRSKVWEYYEIYKDVSGKNRARCKNCKIVTYAIGGTSHGTTNLRNHLDKCMKSSENDVSQMLMNHDSSLRARKIDQDLFREKMAIAIMKHNYSFSMVEHEGLRDLLMYANPDIRPYTRNTAKSDCMKIYRREMKVLKLALKRLPGRICLTSDVWSSITTEGYLSMTAHFVDENWILHSKILNFCHFPPPHNGILLAENVLSFLKEWEIESKIFSITLDNASSCNTMQEHLTDQMRNTLLCGGAFFHVRCSAHILNLIVQDGLSVASEALKKIRESVKYVKGSEGRLIRFSQCCERLGLKIEMGLRLDVPTRWNSTFLMLESALRYRRVFGHYALVEAGYRHNLTDDEWNRAEKICKFLQPFSEITTLFSGCEYPTANLYFQSVWKIQLRMLEELQSEDDVIRDMAKDMKPKFEKYWDSYSVVLAMAVVLDPRYKLEFVDFCYGKIDMNTSEEKTKKVNEALKSLFQEYFLQFSEKGSNPLIVNQGQGDNASQVFEDETRVCFS